MITRYDLTEEVETGRIDVTPVPESHDGRYVSYDDYKAVVDKANELLREAAKVYQMYNKTEEPDGNLVDMQTLQELSDLING